jgi:hypothetical protein
LKQLTLSDSRPGLSEDRVIDTPLTLNDSTFVGKLREPVHRWYQMTYSYSPVLVRALFKRLEVTAPGSMILDPFSGTGTTIIEAKRLGVPSVGFELNPFFALVARACLAWDPEPAHVRSEFQRYLARVGPLAAELRDQSRVAIENRGIEIPRIHNVDRWWRWDVLLDLLAARKALDEFQTDSETRSLLWVGLASILYDVSNTQRLHPTPTFVDRSTDKIDALGALERKLDQVAHDVESTRKLGWPIGTSSKIVLGDSTRIEQVDGQRFTHVITSPPYPNRISYVWYTRPHLFFFRLVSDPSETTQLDLLAPGGTWGKATSDLATREYVPNSKVARDTLSDVCAEILRREGASSRILSNYVMKYFDMMARHFESLKTVLDAHAKLAYVVGDSKINGVSVQTETLVARILEGLGYEASSIVRFRRRIGRRDIFESVVTSTAPA